MNSKDLPTHSHPDVTDRVFPGPALASGVAFVRFSMEGVTTLINKKCRGFTLLEVMVAMVLVLEKISSFKVEEVIPNGIYLDYQLMIVT